MDPQQIINGLAVQLAETTAERDDARQRLAQVMPRVEKLEAANKTKVDAAAARKAARESKATPATKKGEPPAAKVGDAVAGRGRRVK